MKEFKQREFEKRIFEKRIEGWPVEVVGAIAVRASMRTFPLLARPLQANRPVRAFGYWHVADRDSSLLSVLQGYKLGVFISGALEENLLDTAAFSTVKGIAARIYSAANSAAEHTPYSAKIHSKLAQTVLFSVIDCLDIAADYFSSGNFITSAANAIIAALTSYNIFSSRNHQKFVASIEYDLVFLGFESLIFDRKPEQMPSKNRAKMLLDQPLWLNGEPKKVRSYRQSLFHDALLLDAGFDIWRDWYEDRVEGKELNLGIERDGVLVPKEVKAQGCSEINAYLKLLGDDSFTGYLNHARALFIGHGGVGKTSLINVLHGEQVAEEMTPGLALGESRMTIQEGAAVVTRLKNVDDAEMTVHFWDFGGQVMAQATHTFFFTSQCLYVIVMNAREERNANEEAEYWLEHVRAYGGDEALVMLVGNKCDLVGLNLDMASLREKYRNIVGFFPLSCTLVSGEFKENFEIFKKSFHESLKALSENGIGFTAERFAVLKEVRERAKAGDFLKHHEFDDICNEHDIPLSGVGNKEMLLDLFDKLGIVIHFRRLPYLTDYVLNPRWLTYGVYTIMYSRVAGEAEGRICDQDIENILEDSVYRDGEKDLNYPRDKCRLIADAMVAFKVAYRPSYDLQKLVIPALLSTHQPKHDFIVDDALVFQLDFRGFLPRHLLPTLVSDFYQNIARFEGREVVWQNGVLLRPEVGTQAEAMIRADYHGRNLYVQVKGSDAQFYLSHIYQRVLEILRAMTDLPFEEKVQLRPHMRTNPVKMARIGDEPGWISYKILRTAQQSDMEHLPGTDGHIYDVKRVLSAAPIPQDLKPSDIMLSYSRRDFDFLEQLYQDLQQSGETVWYDKGIVGGQAFAEVIDQRIDAAKAVVVLWSDEAVQSEWVMREARRGFDQDKLISVCLPGFSEGQVPGEFQDLQVVPFGEKVQILEAIQLKKRKS